MIKVIKHENMGRSDRGWLHSLFHFSFAEYYKPDNIKFGALRVVNDDRFDRTAGSACIPRQHGDHQLRRGRPAHAPRQPGQRGAASSGATCST